MNLKKVLMHMYKCTFMFLEFGIWSCTLQTPTLNLSVCLQHRTWDVIEYNSLVLYYGWLVLLCLHLKHRNLLFLVMFMKASNRIDSNTNMNNTKAMQCNARMHSFSCGSNILFLPSTNTSCLNLMMIIIWRGKRWLISNWVSQQVIVLMTK